MKNLQYQADRLRDLDIIGTSNINVLADMICCDSDSKTCMYKEYPTCKEKVITVDVLENDLGKQINWKKWTTRRVEKVKKVQGEEIKYTITTSMTTREEKQGTVKKLVEDFQANLKKTCRHLYNIKHQHAVLRKLKENMSENEIIIPMNFSENYCCKYMYNKEIQSVHFGPSQTHVTLHTGVVYFKGECTLSFCTVSDYNKHGPPATLAHLKPILAHVKDVHSTIDTVYFVSEGPTTQYRCKANYLLSSYFFILGIRSATGHFLRQGMVRVQQMQSGVQ